MKELHSQKMKEAYNVCNAAQQTAKGGTQPRPHQHLPRCLTLRSIDGLREQDMCPWEPRSPISAVFQSPAEYLLSCVSSTSPPLTEQQTLEVASTRPHAHPAFTLQA